MQNDLSANPPSGHGTAGGVKDIIPSTRPPGEGWSAHAALGSVSFLRLGLTWLKPALDESFGQVRSGLESFVHAPADFEVLRPAYEQLDRLAGLFDVLQLPASRLCLLEALRLLEVLQHGQGEQDAAAIEPLLVTMSRVALYTEHLRRGEAVPDLALLPACNGLRLVQGLPALDGHAFVQRLALIQVDPPKVPPDIPGRNALEVLAAARSMLERGLLAWLKAMPQAHLAVAKAFAMAASVAPTHEERVLWWAAETLAHTLDDTRMAEAEGLKPLLGRLNRGLRQRAEVGFDSAPKAALEALELAHEVVLLLRASQHPAVTQALEILAWPFLSPDAGEDHEQALLVADSAIISQAADQLEAALEPVQDRFDVAVRSGDTQSILGLAPDLLQLSSTMRMLELDAAARQLESTAHRLRDAEARGMGLDQTSLEQIASTLMFANVEIERLRLGLPEGQGIGLPILAEALDRVAEQGLEDVQRAKEVLLALWKDDGGEDGREAIQSMLERVRGGLELLSLHPWAELVDGVLDYALALAPGVTPPEREQEALADVFASLEYGLETLRDYRQVPVHVLAFGEQALARLGKPSPRRVKVEIEGVAKPGALAAPALGQEVAVATQEGLEHAPQRAEALAQGAEPIPTQTAQAQQVAESPQHPELSPLVPADIDREILEIFIEEAREILDTIRMQFDRWRNAPQDQFALSELRRAFHTLKGGARIIGAQLLGEFGWAFENLLNRVLEGVLVPSEAMFSLLEQAPPHLQQLVDALEGRSGLDVAQVEALCAEVADFISASLAHPQGLYVAPSPAGMAEPAKAGGQVMPVEAGAVVSPAPAPRIDPQLYAIFRSEVEGYLEALRVAIERGRGQGGLHPDAELMRITHSLLGSARTADVPRIVALASQLEHAMHLAFETQQVFDPALLDLSEAVVDGIALLLDDLGGFMVKLPDLDRLEQKFKDAVASLASAPAVPRAAGVVALPQGAEAGLPAQVVTVDYDLPAEQDQQLLKLFLEEAEELLQQLDKDLALWRSEPESKAHQQALQRRLHTFKGSARMAGMRHMGDLAHHLENVFMDLESNRYPVHPDLLDFMQGVLDHLHAMVDHLRSGQPIAPATDLIALLEGLREHGGIPAQVHIVVSETMQGPLTTSAAAEPAAGSVREAGVSAPGMGEVLRVRADLVDRMVSLAGESSIFQARLVQLFGGLGRQLHELEQTVTRLRAQLRRIEIENEAQMLWRFQQETGKAAEEFDPLEFDRFTLQQELSRGVMESLGDIESVHDSLGDDLRDAEMLLTQQGRLAHALQDDLMATRLVRFEDVVPRLARLVRQVARDLGKQAELEVHGGEVELDRGLLNMLLPAFEHMLRNALSHGIERPEERQAHGKSPQGHIRLRLVSQGSLIRMELEDDGVGIDIDALRAKAREKGMLDARAAVDEQAAIQLIFHSGLSTAQEVSMLAGRGVGMDVVAEALRQVGGDIQVESHRGAGTRFTLIVPLTQSITQGVVVKAGEEVFALPYSGIEAILRAPGAQLLALLEGDEPSIEYAGQALPLVDLATLLGLPRMEASVKEVMSPVMVLRLGERRMALRIDALQGSQQLFIKALGPFLAKVHALAGATLLGDGGVVLVLDAAELFRLAGQARARPVAYTEAKPSRPQVLVVDDSITIRKVTTRILERYGIEVMTAKDGLEALSWLHGHLPTVVLSDIEMPRMDGFELLALMRNDARLKSIPVVMITSRTGPKHREKAESLGVDAYIGKPYTEEELIHVLQTWIPGMSEAAASAKGGVA